MIVTLVTRDACGLCGFLRTGFVVPSMRINKRSMRSQGQALSVLPGQCEECRGYWGVSPSLRWWLDPESAARVRAYRLKRWPELAGEVSP